MHLEVIIRVLPLLRDVFAVRVSVSSHSAPMGKFSGRMYINQPVKLLRNKPRSTNQINLPRPASIYIFSIYIRPHLLVSQSLLAQPRCKFIHCTSNLASLLSRQGFPSIQPNYATQKVSKCSSKEPPNVCSPHCDHTSPAE